MCTEKQTEEKFYEDHQAKWCHVKVSVLDFVLDGNDVRHDENRTMCSHCLNTNKSYAPPFCPHCGYRMVGFVKKRKEQSK